MMSLLKYETINASVSPVPGQTVPKECAYSNCCWRTTRGREFVLANKRDVVFCCPILLGDGEGNPELINGFQYVTYF